MSILDAVYCLSKLEFKNKYIKQLRETLSISLDRDSLHIEIKKIFGKRFSTTSLQEYISNRSIIKKYNFSFKEVEPIVYSEYFKINILVISNYNSIKYLGLFRDNRVSILILETSLGYIPIIPYNLENCKYWFNPGIAKNIIRIFNKQYQEKTQRRKEGKEILKSNLTDGIRKPVIKKSEIKKDLYKLRSFYSYKLPELQSLAEELGIETWKMASSKNWDKKNKKVIEMNTKTKHKN